MNIVQRFSNAASELGRAPTMFGDHFTGLYRDAAYVRENDRLAEIRKGEIPRGLIEFGYGAQELGEKTIGLPIVAGGAALMTTVELGIDVINALRGY